MAGGGAHCRGPTVQRYGGRPGCGRRVSGREDSESFVGRGSAGFGRCDELDMPRDVARIGERPELAGRANVFAVPRPEEAGGALARPGNAGREASGRGRKRVRVPRGRGRLPPVCRNRSVCPVVMAWVCRRGGGSRVLAADGGVWRRIMPDLARAERCSAGLCRVLPESGRSGRGWQGADRGPAEGRESGAWAGRLAGARTREGAGEPASSLRARARVGAV